MKGKCSFLIFYTYIFSITTRQTRRTLRCVIIFGPAFLNWSKGLSVLWRKTTTLITGRAKGNSEMSPNFVLFRLFTQSDGQCRAICEDTPDCRWVNGQQHIM